MKRLPTSVAVARNPALCAAPGDVVLTRSELLNHGELALAQPLPVAAPDKIG
jgi:hypothetical protein